MTRSPDILFMAEYIKNVLYFATIRTGKTLKSTNETHYFSIDNELVYENYYADFGPLNLGCVYKYCKILNDKLKQYLNKQTIVHYTSIDPKKKANAAFLLGCYGVLYLSLPPRDALKPLLVHGQSYRPFQDATQGESVYTISLADCLQAIKKARDLGLFNFQDFNYEEYDRLDKIQGGDLNWILPGKFLAFIGPVDYSVSLYHPPEMYIKYFLENNVQIVIRLNKKLYDGKVFHNAGIIHYDLFFADGSCPPRHILQKFLQISEECTGALAVHCKAGLGRTGSLIGCYLIKHYRMTAHESIGWMRICRPGSVIGHQQGWLEQLEPWLMKQGNLYRKRTFNDTEKLPYHEFGVYSIAEKTKNLKPVVFHKSQSPPPPAQRLVRPEPACSRPQSSKIRDETFAQRTVPHNSVILNQNYKVEYVLFYKTSQKTFSRLDKSEAEEEEVFLTSCDLTIKPVISMTQLKGCVIRNNTIFEDNDESGSIHELRATRWKELLCCKPCLKTFQDAVWTMSVRCARVAPGTCYSNRFCTLIDMAEKEQHDWRVKSPKMNAQKIPYKGEQYDGNSAASRRGSGAGEPRPPRSPSRSSTIRQYSTVSGSPVQRSTVKSNVKRDSTTKTLAGFQPTITTFRSTNSPIIKNVNDARKFLIRSSLYNEERERNLNSSITVTPQYSARLPNYFNTAGENMSHITPTSYSTVTRTTQPQNRRRLGRSPSPPQTRMSSEQTRATNTPANTIRIPIPTTQKFLAKDASKSALKDALSRLKLTTPRDGSIGAASIGAASLGARRDAPVPKQAPSVRSDERPLATQGDMLNSIKFQRRMRESMHTDKVSSVFNNKPSTLAKEKTNVRHVTSRTNSAARQGVNQEYTLLRDRAAAGSRNMFSPNARPSSPKGRRTPSFY